MQNTDHIHIEITSMFSEAGNANVEQAVRRLAGEFIACPERWTEDQFALHEMLLVYVDEKAYPEAGDTAVRDDALDALVAILVRSEAFMLVEQEHYR